jgi:hypothetical protein
MLRRNSRESTRVTSDSDEGWRDRLREVVVRLDFFEGDGSRSASQDSIRSEVWAVLDTYGHNASKTLQFRFWEQLIDGRKARRGLGARIRGEIERSKPERVPEFDELGVEEGIDADRPDEAERFLGHVPEDENLLPLPALLNPNVRAALERLAKPRVLRTTRPLSEIVRLVADMVAERETVQEESESTVRGALRISPRTKSGDGAASRSLFAWLFGPTLSQVSDGLADDELTLQLADDLKLFADFSAYDPEREVDDEEAQELFRPLELMFTWSDGLGGERRVEWDPTDTPGLVALWRLCSKADFAYWRPTQDTSFATWLESSLQPLAMLGAVTSPSEDTGGHEIVQRLDELRSKHLSAMGGGGLSSAAVRDYVGAYSTLLDILRADHVPAGVGRPDVEEFLRRDFYLGGAVMACLPCHPIRLRWVAAYLDRMAELMVQAMRRELVTNPVNPTLFFEEILGASPQSQPPVAVSDERLLLAVREQDWFEIYAPLKDSRGERRDWLADLDDRAIDDVAGAIGRYLDAYPYKADGLHLLFVVRRNGARGLHRLVKRVLERTGRAGAALKLTLFVDSAEVRAVEEALQDFDDQDHRAFSNRPRVQAALHEWSDPEQGLPDLVGMERLVDVAVVPNLFGASTRTQESTVAGGRQKGRFRALLDEPSRLEPVRGADGKSTTVSRVLLPEAPDQLLESWSTVVTRQFRGSPVSESPRADDVDHVMIRVSLDRKEEREFFCALHACSHWVVTVDAFVGREQIEALDGGPDVIQVKTGVGANGGYRMVVSSKAGRRFIEQRVERRLSEQLSRSILANPQASAAEIYSRARLLVPGIVLRSLGLGRTTAEMVGLVLARTRVEQVDPAYVWPHGFQSWISLDEHTDWSGGPGKVRADLVRFRGRFVEGRLKLQIDVVEAKLRQQPPVGRADAQLNRSVEMLSAAFGGLPGSKVGYVDRDVWSRLIGRAIDQSTWAADGTPAASHAVIRGQPAMELDPEMQSALREGNCDLERISGVLVSLTDERMGRDETTPVGHRWLKMSTEEVAAILSALDASHVYPLIAPSIREDALLESLEEFSVTPPIGAATSAESLAPTLVAEVNGDEQRPRGGATLGARRRLQDLIDALHIRKVEVKPAGGADSLEGPGFYVFRLELARDVRPEAVFALDTHLQYQLGLEAGQIPRIYVDRGAVVVEVPKREAERYYIAAEDLWKRFNWRLDRLAAPLGCDVSDNPVAIDFSSSRSPHLLIGGMTGGGKSVALEALLLGLVRHYPPEKLELRIIDPKGNEFNQFEGLPHLTSPPGMDAEDAIHMLERTCEEMDARYQEMKRLSQERKERVRDIVGYNALVGRSEAFKWILVVLDEFADLTSDKDDKKAIEGLLQRIAQKARACGIHAIVATQKPSAEVISTTTRSNLGAQLALRVRGAVDSRVIMETSGAESLAGNGDAFLRLSGEEPIRIQCAKAG